MTTVLAAVGKEQVRPLPAQAGTAVDSGGKDALRPIISAVTWKKCALWGALLGGVLLLARMAWRLTKELTSHQSRKYSTKMKS